ncbi:DUF3037 domain-containing protein [Candidatus Chlorohelix sp.]|uniref:DUF3037 domain-containing protein n=1 Tax=Candidatus Chlorohelix sp. TaxID=3139201 RepID=UPI00303C9705
MPDLVAFDYAIIRVVPRVERGECLNVGIILYCRPRRYLNCAIALDRNRLGALYPQIDIEAVEKHLAGIPLICAGSVEGGTISALSQQERFHWLVAPRSAIIQTSPPHSGLCAEPALCLEHLMETMVRLPTQ